MAKLYYIFLIIFLNIGPQSLFSQKFILPFGDVRVDDLSNHTYKPDAGADALILSDIGTASLNYSNGFYVELERDVRIRIVNSNGFDYANIEIPFSTDDVLEGYRASTFNLRNGEISETQVSKKSFIIDKTTRSVRTLKFSFPDVHEGSVIEYSYKITMKDNAVYDLVPWEFQSGIPVVMSSLTISYPEYFVYKSIISGSAVSVNSAVRNSTGYFLGHSMEIINTNWSVQNMPAFIEEPYIKSKKEHLTGITFELERVSLPGQSMEEITPSYQNLTEKLLERDDFGQVLKTNFKEVAGEVTKGLNDDLSKLIKLHKYVSSKLLWNGVKDFTASGSLRSVFKKEKGNSADLNMILICMLRALNIKADPVILSTRSNGEINLISAMMRQFNYLIAHVSINGINYLVDVTDPQRPFNELPFDCLNGTGRIVDKEDPRFIDLKNDERFSTSSALDISIDKSGIIRGSDQSIYSGYSAFNVRKLVKIESEEGYSDIVKSQYSDFDFSDFEMRNITEPDSVLKVDFNFKTRSGTQLTGDEIIFSPSFFLKGRKSPFYLQERKYPVDYGCPSSETGFLNVKIPEGFTITDKPENLTLNLGTNDGKFEYTTEVTGNTVKIRWSLSINKTLFSLREYGNLRNFYTAFLRKQVEPVILHRNLNSI